MAHATWQPPARWQEARARAAGYLQLHLLAGDTEQVCEYGELAAALRASLFPATGKKNSGY
jgi:hypothetical protein